MRSSAVALFTLVALFAGGPAGAAVAVQGGIGFVAVSGAPPGGELVLEDARHAEVGRGTTDRLGSLLFRDLVPGRGYVVRDPAAGGLVSDPITVPKIGRASCRERV